MQTTGAADLIKFPPQLGQTVANHAPVRFNLGFARSTKKAETAALSLQVSPTPHQPTCLIVEMRQFNLQPAFSGRGALTENFQDQASARSEEHTSELQSLMRISYAVFCLKNKIHHTTYTRQSH